MAKTATKSTPQAAYCTVFDHNAQGTKPRVHTVERIDYELYAPNGTNKGTDMPIAHALIFLKDPSFLVVDPEGNQMRARGGGEADYQVMKLPNGQVVAGLDELTVDALLARAAKLSGGDAFNKASGKARIIEFLLTAGETPERQELERPAPDADLIDDEGDDEDGDPDFAKQLGIS